MSDIQTCENCGRRIGHDEQAEFWKHHVVCAGCKVALAIALSRAKSAAAPSRSASRSAHAHAASRTTPSHAHAHERTGEQGHARGDGDAQRHAHAAAKAPAPAPAVLETEDAPAALYGCAQCGGAFPLAEVAQVDGQILCTSCATADGAAASPWGGSGANGWPAWLPLAAVGAVLAVVIVTSALFMVHGGDADAAEPPPAAHPVKPARTSAWRGDRDAGPAPVVVAETAAAAWAASPAARPGA